MAETFLLWAVVITAVVLLVRYLLSLGGAGSMRVAGAPREEGLLAERYARGDIDGTEYQQRIAVLRQNR